MIDELRTISEIEKPDQISDTEVRSGRLNLTDKERKDRARRLRILARKANPEKYRKAQIIYRERIKKEGKKNTHRQVKVKLSKEEYRKRQRERYIERKNKDPEGYKKKKRDYRARTIDYIRKRDREYNINNKEARKKSQKERYYKEKDKLLKLSKEWRINNVERLKEYRKKRQSISNYQTSLYTANKINAIPKWLTLDDLSEIKRIYKECRLKTKVENVKYSVDHFYPLNSDWVCGLHCPLNLRIVTFSENCSKQNRRTEEHTNA